MLPKATVTAASARDESLRRTRWLLGGRTYEPSLHQHLVDGDAGEIYGGSVFLTGRTLIGPLTIGIGSTSTDSWSLWLSVGRPVGHGTILERGIFR